MLRMSLGVDPDAKVELPEEEEETTEEEAAEEVKADEGDDDEELKVPDDAKTAEPVPETATSTEDEVEGDANEAPAEAKEEL